MRQLSHKQFISCVLLIILMVAAFLQRIDPIYLWDVSPDQYIVHGEPLLTNLDGYFYLNVARELAEGSYSSTDSLRGWPDDISRSSIPPLPGLTIWLISKFSGYSINWVGVFLPCFLGVFLGIPVFYLGMRWGGPVMALPSVALSLFPLLYANRTALGVLDTDCLNATLSLSCACCFLLFSVIETNKRFISGGLGVISFVLLAWWWDQTPETAIILGLGPLLIATVLYYRPTYKNAIVTGICVLILITIFLFFSGISPVLDFFHSVINKFQYISKQQGHLYPNIGETIGEQTRVPLKDIAIATTVYPPLIWVCILGSIWLLIRKKESWVLLPMYIIGAFGLFFALRFLIFTTPIFALGAGFAISEIHRRFDRYHLFLIISAFAVIVISWKLFDRGTIRKSQFPAKAVAGMIQVKEITPPKSVIWSWWDQGHALVYWSERRTVNDGMVHGSDRTHANSVPLISDNDRLAANYMQFYSVHGLKGIRKFYKQVESFGLKGNEVLFNLLKAGPTEALSLYPEIDQTIKQEWRSFLFPANAPPLYVFLDEVTLNNLLWIHYFGKWDIYQKKSPKVLPSLSLRKRFNEQGWIIDDFGIPTSPPHPAFNPEKKLFTVPTVFTKPIFVNSFTVNAKTQSTTYPNAPVCSEPTRVEFKNNYKFSNYETNTGDYHLDVYLENQVALLHDLSFAQSLVNRLFRRKNNFDSHYFTSVVINNLGYQIWQVKGDSVSK